MVVNSKRRGSSSGTPERGSYGIWPNPDEASSAPAADPLPVRGWAVPGVHHANRPALLKDVGRLPAAAALLQTLDGGRHLPATETVCRALRITEQICVVHWSLAPSS